MATIDEIFENMPAEASVTYEELIIDAEARQIIVPDAEALFGVESDTHSERKHFRCPRYVGNGLDLASCFLRVNFRNANGDVDSYLIEDTAIDGEDITFSWVFSKKVTAYKGAVKFNVCAIMGAGLPEWNTTLAEGTVLEGLEPDSSTAEAETADVVAQLLATVAAQTAAVEAVGAAQCAEVQKVGENTTEEAKAAVEAKGEAVRATIPEDYSTLSATVDKLTRDRAAAIVCEAEGETIQVSDSSADPLVGLRIFGKSTQNGTPTPDAPVEIVSAKAPTVTVCGKNLVKNGAVSSTLKGVVFTVNADGSFTAKGTSTGEIYFGIDYDAENIRPGERYHLSGCPVGGSATTYRLYAQTSDGKNFSADTGSGVNFTAKPGQWQVIFVIYGANTVDFTVRPMLRLASVTDDTYEPYRGDALTLSTPTALPGIPVTSGGNYTDANGQQWIADEIDLARGVYVQRVNVRELVGTEDFEDYIADNNAVTLYLSHKNNSDIICSHAENGRGVYWANTSRIAFRVVHWGVSTLQDFKTFVVESYNAGAPVTVHYMLSVPIETPLSTEEIEAYKALLANKPTTTVLNDAGAWMALKYAADPKTYIDNKIAALLAANN